MRDSVKSEGEAPRETGELTMRRSKWNGEDDSGITDVGGKSGYMWRNTSGEDD